MAKKEEPKIEFDEVTTQRVNKAKVDPSYDVEPIIEVSKINKAEFLSIYDSHAPRHYKPVISFGYRKAKFILASIEIIKKFVEIVGSKRPDEE